MRKAVEPNSPSRQMTSPLRNARRLTAWMFHRRNGRETPPERLADRLDLVVDQRLDVDVIARGQLGRRSRAGGSARRSGRSRMHSPQATQRRAAHRRVEVEGDPRGVALAHPADDLILLDLVAAADAAVAEDAGVVVDGDDQRRIVRGSSAGRPWNRPPATPNRPASASSSQSPACCCSLAQGLGWSAISRSSSVFTERSIALAGRRIGGRDRVDDHLLLDAMLARGQQLVATSIFPELRLNRASCTTQTRQTATGSMYVVWQRIGIGFFARPGARLVEPPSGAPSSSDAASGPSASPSSI